MGSAEIMNHRFIIHSRIITYGNAADAAITELIRDEIETMWNEPKGVIEWKRKELIVIFKITASFEPGITPVNIYSNIDPRNNYFRIEEFAIGDISFVDGLNSNTGYFKLQNIVDNSTTAAHEFGHTLGLDHPHKLDIRGGGIPGIMYPRGTLVDPHFQYYPEVAAGEKGGTLNPFTRKVLQKDIDDLHLEDLDFNENGMAVVGGFSSVWHEKHLP
jgi:hypothetical protein